MKRCPECSRDYYDETMSFCLDDGTPLLDGPASIDGPETAIYYGSPSSDSLRGPTGSDSLRGPTGSDALREPSGFDPFLGPSSSEPFHSNETAILPANSTGEISPQPQDRKKPLIFGGITLAIIVILGLLGYLLLYKSDDGPIHSIAVLPFQNKSGDQDSEYLSDGLTESLIHRLSQIPNLKVSPTSAVQRYKDKEADTAEIASALGVDAVMTGRVVQKGEGLIVSVELVDARNNKLLWGERYDRKLADLLATQRDIAATIAQKLHVELSGDNSSGVGQKYTDSNEAYQLYLKGRFYGSRRTAPEAQRSIDYFQQAIAIDPDFALANAGLAESYWFLALYSYPQQNELIPKSRELAEKALALDASLAGPHSLLGMICFNYDRDFACMEREQKLAIELDPNYAEGHRRYGLYLLDLGKFQEARVASRRALEIDPLSPVTNFLNAQIPFFERKYDESEPVSKKNVEFDATFWYAHLQLFYVYRMKRDHASAVEELAKVQDARGEPDAAKLIRDSFTGGDWPSFLRKITAERSRLKLYPYFVATLYAELGDQDKAFAALNEAIETKDQHTCWIKVDPFMDPLRGEPRFQPILQKAGFTE